MSVHALVKLFLLQLPSAGCAYSTVIPFSLQLIELCWKDAEMTWIQHGDQQQAETSALHSGMLHVGEPVQCMTYTA